MNHTGITVLHASARAPLLERVWVRVAREAVGAEGRVVPQQWLLQTTTPGIPADDRPPGAAGRCARHRTGYRSREVAIVMRPSKSHGALNSRGCSVLASKVVGRWGSEMQRGPRSRSMRASPTSAAGMRWAADAFFLPTLSEVVELAEAATARRVGKSGMVKTKKNDWHSRSGDARRSQERAHAWRQPRAASRAKGTSRWPGLRCACRLRRHVDVHVGDAVAANRATRSIGPARAASTPLVAHAARWCLKASSLHPHTLKRGGC